MEEKEKYYIAIIGDDTLFGNFMFSKEEAEFVTKVLRSLKASGPYVPTIDIFNLKEEEERMKKAYEEKMKENEQKIRHAMGLDYKGPSAFEIAFNKAKKQRK